MVRVAFIAGLGLLGTDAAKIQAASSTEVEAGGPANCAYKCGLQWNQRNTWSTSALGGFHLYEYTACVEGCNLCSGGSNSQCQRQCKEINWPTYAYTFNSAKNLKKFDNTQLPSKQALLACTKKCLAPYGSSLQPGTGGPLTINNNGYLPASFLSCSTGCYDKHFTAVAQETMEACQKGASASCSVLDADCYTADECFIGLAKGVVEADKACIQGCSQNLCQEGAQCFGKGFFNPNYTPNTGCALITSQTVGVRETINPGYYGQQSDLGDCCNAVLQRCGYAPGMGPKKFGRSLGYVIASDKTGCMYTDDQGRDAVYDVIDAKSPWECDCTAFFDQCMGQLGDQAPPADWICYGKNGPRVAASPVILK